MILVGAVLGLVLGLLGGGGGILAVPMLVALGEPVLVASTMSLVIVAAGAAAALIPHQRAGRVDWRIGLTFGALGSVGAVVGARLAQFASPAVLLGGLAVMLVLGATLMLRTARRARAAVLVHAAEPVPAGGVPLGEPLVLTADDAVLQRVSWPRTVLLATAVGLVTGFFGVGAGFVVVPALVAAMHVPMRRASATALVVIVMNSAVALAARHENMGPLGLTLGLAVVTAVFGIIGAAVSHRIPAWVLSGAFGVLMALVAVYTVAQAVHSA